MKTALDLPDDLVKEIKYRAIRDGKKLKDEMAYLLRRGLDASTERETPSSVVIKRDSKSGLPVVQRAFSPNPSNPLTPSNVADILLEQEVAWTYETGR